MEDGLPGRRKRKVVDFDLNFFGKDALTEVVRLCPQLTS
jgi:hypothetical protein